jgi:uncharacterized protein YndB with AHSA1/START domain
MVSPDARTDPLPSRRVSRPPATVLLARRLAQNPERVYDAWLDPEQVSRWLVAASGTDRLLRLWIDPRVGGRFSLVLRRDGREIEHAGSYVEIARPFRLAFTWSVVAPGDTSGVRSVAGSLVTLDFAPAGSGTELRLTHEGVPEEQALKVEERWSKIIQALAQSIGS